MEPVTANRAPNVSAFSTSGSTRRFRFGRFGRLTGMVDVFNLFNRGTVTNFPHDDGCDVPGGDRILDPRIVRFGVRYDF